MGPELADRPRASFNPATKEDALTKRLKVYVENYTARQRGLLGMWSAEDIIGDIDPATGDLIQERRTDIVYGWNDDAQDMRLVFEFKRLGRQKRHRDHYLRDQGLARFVTGIYSRRQAVAAMVGVLLDPEPDVVPHIRTALTDAALRTALRLRPTPAGEPIARPSALFTAADFDTEHERDPSLAPTHGYDPGLALLSRFRLPHQHDQAKGLNRPSWAGPAGPMASALTRPRHGHRFWSARVASESDLLSRSATVPAMKWRCHNDKGERICRCPVVNYSMPTSPAWRKFARPAARRTRPPTTARSRTC